METFLVIGVCVLCYELCEFLYQCGRDSKEDGQNSTVAASSPGVDRLRVVYTLPEPETPNSVEKREYSSQMQ